MNKESFILKFILLFTIIIFKACNPFAPHLAENSSDTPVIGDQTTVEGVFKNFRYAYIFKDTTVYSRLLADNYIFTYWNYDLGLPKSWGRAEDMIATSRLFDNVQDFDLIWSEVWKEEGDSLFKLIHRDFYLNIRYYSSNSDELQVKAAFQLERQKTADEWKITICRDESY
ncbi:MAG: hypothetical protein QG635_328 [Bacteroidota bacterium]|nr:hypothetical protein [Bacteroidota bacterium]